jgi:hypothetical protein
MQLHSIGSALQGARRSIEADNAVEMLFVALKPREQLAFAATEIDDTARTRGDQRRDHGFHALVVQFQRPLKRLLSRVTRRPLF